MLNVSNQICIESEEHNICNEYMEYSLKYNCLIYEWTLLGKLVKRIKKKHMK